MKAASLPILTAMVVAQASHAEPIPVPNGEFQMYKPGSDYTVTAVFTGTNAFARGVGDAIELAGGNATYSDGSPDGVTGDGIPDIDLPGWAPLQSGNDLVPNGVDGSTGMNLFAAWGGDGRIQSADPLGTIESGSVYTIKIMVGGPDSGPIQGPLAFHLAADGEPLTPSASVDPTLPNGGAFQEISRTYDADSIAGHIGAEMTIILGVEDANDAGNRVIFDNVSMEVEKSGAAFQLVITPDGGNPGSFDFAWDSQAGKLYDLVSSTGLATPPPGPGWVVWDGRSDIPSGGTTTTLDGVPGGGDPARFFAVVEKDPPPVTVFSENFDLGVIPPALPAGWDTGFDAVDTLQNTVWGLGTPTAVGPPAASSGANCIGTNLAANYGTRSNTWVRTPAINLSTATGATLVFQQWVDMDDFDLGDTGTVRVLDADALPAVAVLETLRIDIQGLAPAGWEEFSEKLTAASLGKSVVLEFLFVSDSIPDGDSSGWYIDDVTVTVPGS